MWKQRLRVAWLKDGDRNNKFFHTKASNRQRRNRITSLKIMKGHGLKETNYMNTLYPISVTCSQPIMSIDLWISSQYWEDE